MKNFCHDMQIFFLFLTSFLCSHHNGLAQRGFVDSLSTIIQSSPDGSNKLSALKTISRELWNQERENASVFYSNMALALQQKLKIQEEVNAVANELAIAEKKSASQYKKSIQALTIKLESIVRLQDTLDIALKEYEKRSSSFADDLVVTANRDKELIASQQRLAIQHLQMERTKRNWVIAAGLITFTLLSFIFRQVYRRRQALNQLELQQLNSKVLRSQLNPHFIFNALSSVRKYIRQHPDLADNYLVKFSALMRQVLENSREDKISLAEEIAMLENYMLLEALRLPQGFDYAIIIDPSADAANTMIPPMILQPAVENAIWHGLNPLKRRGKISFQFREVNNLLQVSIEDNGVGMGSTSTTTEGAEKKRSLGLQITRERIELLNRKSKMKGSLMQQLFDSGSIVNVFIPL